MLLVFSHGRRKIEYFGVTMNPNKCWVKQQLRNAFPGGHGFKYLIRDNDPKFWFGFDDFAKFLNLVDIPIGRGRPWQNGYCERVIGTIKWELINKVIVLNRSQLHSLLKNM